MSLSSHFTKICHQPGADPGFPVGGGANPPGGGRTPTYDFAKFPKQLHEIEKILGHCQCQTPLPMPMFRKSVAI